MNAELNDKYVVLYSPSQQEFHSGETFGEMITRNHHTFRKQTSGGDFVVLGVFDTIEEGRVLVRKLQTEVPNPKWT